MQQEELRITPAAEPARWQFWMIALAILAYLLNLVGVAWTTVLGDGLSTIALFVLGLTVSRLTFTQLATAPTWGGKRVPTAWRRLRIFAVSTSIAVYLALVFGALVTNIGGLWACTTWPLCAPVDGRAGLTLLHRGVAGTATLLVFGLAIWALRHHTLPLLQRTARWTIGFMIAQNLVGLLMVLAATDAVNFPLTYARFAHLAVGALSWAAVAALATMVVRVPPLFQPAPRVAAVRSERQPSLLMDYVGLTKPRVITLLIFTTLAAMFITPAGVPSLSLVLWTMLGGWLMPAGAHALNCYFDRDIDAKMGRTGRRPIPNGRIPAWHALVLGLGLGALAFAVLALFVNLYTAWVALAGYIYYVVLYTIVLKRHSVHNIVIGGGAGAIPPLVGWTAVTGSLTWASLLLFAIIFYWTPPHFWALALIRKKDYANAGVPMLPVVSGDAETKRQILIYTIIMIALSLLPTPIGMMGVLYLILAAVLGLSFLAYVLRLLGNDTTSTRWGLYRFSLLYLFLLFGAMMVDRLM